MEDLWPKVLDSLKERVGQQNFDIWIKPIRFLSLSGENLELEVPNRFFKEWITEQYSSHIKEVMSFLTEKRLSLQFRIRNDKLNTKEPLPSSSPKKGPKTISSDETIFNPKYTFENFVVGASNQFANAACLAVANLPAKNYNPLFIYGGLNINGSLGERSESSYPDERSLQYPDVGINL